MSDEKKCFHGVPNKEWCDTCNRVPELEFYQEVRTGERQLPMYDEDLPWYDDDKNPWPDMDDDEIIDHITKHAVTDDDDDVIFDLDDKE